MASIFQAFFFSIRHDAQVAILRIGRVVCQFEGNSGTVPFGFNFQPPNQGACLGPSAHPKPPDFVRSAGLGCFFPGECTPLLKLFPEPAGSLGSAGFVFCSSFFSLVFFLFFLFPVDPTGSNPKLRSRRQVLAAEPPRLSASPPRDSRLVRFDGLGEAATTAAPGEADLRPGLFQVQRSFRLGAIGRVLALPSPRHLLGLLLR